jgi:hypothetical protein
VKWRKGTQKKKRRKKRKKSTVRMTWTRRKAPKCSEKSVVVCNEGELLCMNPKGLIIQCKDKLEVVNGLVFKPNTLYLDKCEVLQVDSSEAYTLGWV